MAKRIHDQLALIVYADPATLPERERPQARVLREGAAMCNTSELLQVLIGGQYAETAARQLLASCNDLRGIATKSALELASLAQGVGLVKAAQLKVCFELGKRLMTQPSEARPLIKTPSDAAYLLMHEMGLLEQEEVRVILLDARNRMIGSPLMIYRGSLSSATMRVCEVFKAAIRHNAASIILLHNHPSSDVSPSADDIHVTKELIKAGKLLDIELLDHLILSSHEFTSLKERGFAFGE